MKLNNEFFIFITTIPSDLDLDQDDEGDLDEGLGLPRCL